ncbi:hypothetical protein CHS0354_010659 [Potamilus streckersoni]|uniref:Fucolectin tachylectin-4 pentraxin-1 domain-containing protein n=1 Tax=Potamilus streckersoni TaxID=2493646 RepID=A0AAE0TC80_9BIVA|nr:hypothetical protein CHS0354_010659 [Potamilus streckersoni]
MTWKFFILLIWCLSAVRSQYEPYGGKEKCHGLDLPHIMTSTGRNVARGKPANQSTTYQGYNASLGVDGGISTNFSDGTCSHTNEGPNYSWWIVNLAGFYFIKFIRIYQRIGMIVVILWDVL